MHVVRIKNGQASYSNRFVDTLRLQQEKAAGHPVSIKVRRGPARSNAQRKRGEL